MVAQVSEWVGQVSEGKFPNEGMKFPNGSFRIKFPNEVSEKSGTRDYGGSEMAILKFGR